MNNKLTPEYVIEKAKVFDETVTHILDIKDPETGNIDSFEVICDKYFSNEKIDKFVSELKDVLLQVSESEKMTKDIYHTINRILVIRNFTDIRCELDLESLVPFATSLYNLGILGELMNKFDEKELIKLDERTSEYFTLLPEMQKILIDMVQQIKAKQKGGKK